MGKVGKDNSNKNVSAIYVAFCQVRLLFWIVLFASAIILVGINSFAWFSYSDKGQGMLGQISVQGSGFAVLGDINYYPVTEIQTAGDGNVYTFKNIPIDNLPTYDPYGITYQEYKFAVVVSFTYRSEVGQTFVLTMDGESSVDTLFSSPNYTSNVLMITNAQPQGEILSDFVTANVKSDNHNYSVIQYNVQDGTYAKTPVDILTLESGEHTVWFVVEYNVEMVSKICDKRLIEDQLDKLEYNSDIKLKVTKQGE